MIIKGGSRRSGQFFASHLMKTEENERVAVTEMRGLYADDLPEAFREMRLLASGSGCTNYFYHATLNPRVDERLTPEQWGMAVDTLERNLNFTGHVRFVVEHEKEGRTHRHVVWSRIDPDTMRATPDSHNYLAHDRTRLELEQAFNHEPTAFTPQPSQRKSRHIKDWEHFRAQSSAIDPREVRAAVTQLWQQSDSGPAFVAALEQRGYVLCKGDRRDFCVIDQAGDSHSLARRIDGVRAADIRTRLADLDRDSLMSVKEATNFVKSQARESTTSPHSAGDGLIQKPGEAVINDLDLSKKPASLVNPKFLVLDRLAHERVMAETPDTYPVATSAEHFAKMSEAVLRGKEVQLSHAGWQSVFEWGEHAWETLWVRVSEVIHKVESKTEEFWQEWMNKLEDRQKEHDEQDRER